MSELHAMTNTFICKKRGEMEIKGKGSRTEDKSRGNGTRPCRDCSLLIAGQMETFFLLGEGEVIESLVPPERALELANGSTPAPGALPLGMIEYELPVPADTSSRHGGTGMAVIAGCSTAVFPAQEGGEILRRVPACVWNGGGALRCRR